MGINIKSVAADLRTWLFLGGVIVVVSAKVLGYAELPKRVDNVEEHVEGIEDGVENNKDGIRKLVLSIDKFVGVQQVREEKQMIIDEAQDKREGMMFELLKQIRTENGR